MTREQKVALLRPLVERMHVGHCWRKTKDGPRRIAERFDEIKLSEHAAGTNAYGLCPIAPGTNTTRVACLDLDSHKGETPWADMVRVADKIAAALMADLYEPQCFRSSGGQGIHIYMVWDEPQDAYSVREMLRVVLERCGFQNGTKGVAHGYVEIFPKQAAVAPEGYGSMFVLPFAGKSAPLDHFDGWRASAPVPVLAAPPKLERTAADVPGLQRIREALSAIPNDGDRELDYDNWRNIIFAIHDATEGSDEGLAVAHEWSARSGKYDPDFLDNRVWPYIQSERGGAVITARTLFAAAAEHGWTDPAIADEFECLPREHDEAEHLASAADVALKRFAPIPAHIFAQGKAADWIVKGVLPEADLAVVYGESGSGKSFFVLDLAGSIAQGVEWRGKRTAKGLVIYIAAEGAGGFRKRLNAYASHHGVALEQLDIAVIPEAPNFMKADDIKALVEAVRGYGKPVLVIVDTLAQVMPGANENAGEDMGKALAHCRTLRAVTGAMVVLIHHSGKDSSKGARGWSGLNAASDCTIEIVRAEHDRVATVTKLKDGEDGAEFGFKLQQVPIGMDDEGEVVSSCVVEYTTAVSKEKRRALSKPPHAKQKIVWQAVCDLQGLDGQPPTVHEVFEEAKKQIVLDPDAARDMRGRDIQRAFEALITQGRLVLDGSRVRLPEGARE